MLLRKITGSNPEIVINQNELVDLEVFSSFPFRNSSEKILGRIKFEFSTKSRHEYISKTSFGHRENYDTLARKRIWFTGENKRPPNSDFDLTLSFEKTDPLTKNLYFPYWMTRVDWGLGSSEYEIYPTMIQLTRSRKLPLMDKKVCLFSSNLEPSRSRIIKLIEQSPPIDKFGTAYGRKVESKLAIARNYSFQICNENDLYPGYVTEKIQEAWVAGNIPIWSGLLPDNHDFNLEAIMNVTNMRSDEIIDTFNDLSLELIEHKRNQPLLTRPTDILFLEKSLANLL